MFDLAIGIYAIICFCLAWGFTHWLIGIGNTVFLTEKCYVVITAKGRKEPHPDERMLYITPVQQTFFDKDELKRALANLAEMEPMRTFRFSWSEWNNYAYKLQQMRDLKNELENMVHLKVTMELHIPL